jgi:hypothetical protein
MLFFYIYNKPLLTMKLPITFEQFSKDPTKGLLFLVIVAIGYLYVDIKLSNSDLIGKYDERVATQDQKIELLTEHVRRSDSTLGYMISKVEMMQIMR